MGRSTPLQTRIEMQREDNQFHLYVGVYNPTDETVHCRTMSGALFSPKLREKGGDELWRDPRGAAMAVTPRSIEPYSWLARTYEMEDSEAVADEMRDVLGDDDYYSEEEIQQMVEHRPSVDADDIDSIVSVEVTVPSTGNYYESVTKQFDLRHNPERVLVDELPTEGL